MKINTRCTRNKVTTYCNMNGNSTVIYQLVVTSAWKQRKHNDRHELQQLTRSREADESRTGSTRIDSDRLRVGSSRTATKYKLKTSQYAWISLVFHVEQVTMVEHSLQNYDTICVRFFARYTCNLFCSVGFLPKYVSIFFS